MVIDVVNDAQDRLNQNNISDSSTTFSEARNILATMEWMDMSSEVTKRLSTNATTIINVDNQIKEALKKQSGGCYIATMAYGSYEHPKVLVLREFRDNKLSQIVLGRRFIKYYYAISPSLVTVLKNHERINKLIRYLLNMFVRSLKNG